MLVLVAGYTDLGLAAAAAAELADRNMLGIAVARIELEIDIELAIGLGLGLGRLAVVQNCFVVWVAEEGGRSMRWRVLPVSRMDSLLVLREKGIHFVERR